MTNNIKQKCTNILITQKVYELICCNKKTNWFTVQKEFYFKLWFFFTVASDPPPPYTPPTLDRGPAQPRRPSSTYSQSSDTIPVRPPQPNRQTSSEPSDQTAAPPTYQSVVRTVSNTEEGGANTDSALITPRLWRAIQRMIDWFKQALYK